MSLTTYLLTKFVRSCKLDHPIVWGCLACPGNNVPSFLHLLAPGIRESWNGWGWEGCCPEGASCVSVCAHWIWSCHWAPTGKSLAPSLHPPFPFLWALIRFPFSFPSPGRPVPALGEMLQTLILLCGPLLDSRHYVHVSLALRSPELETELQVWSWKCWVEVKITSLTWQYI